MFLSVGSLLSVKLQKTKRRLAMNEISRDQDNSQMLSNDKADRGTTARAMVFITVKMYISLCVIYILIDIYRF